MRSAQTRSRIAPHFVSTVPKEGLGGNRDELLLRIAASDFDVFVTVDRNLVFEQNVSNLPMPVIVLHAISNRLADLKPLVPELLQTIGFIKPSQVVHVPRAAAP